MSVEIRTIAAPFRRTPVNVLVLGQEVLARHPETGATDELWYLPRENFSDIASIGPESHLGFQGIESKIEILNVPTPEKLHISTSELQYANPNRTLPLKIENARDRFAGLGDWNSVARLNLALAIARPGVVRRFDESKLWQEAFAVHDFLGNKEVDGHYYKDPATLTVMIAGMRAVYGDQLKEIVNESFIYGAPFMDWVKHGAEKEARREFKKHKLWQNTLDDDRRLNNGDDLVSPGERLHHFMKEWEMGLAGPKAEYEQFAQGYRQRFYETWLSQKADSIRTNPWSQNHLADQPVNRALRGLFHDLIQFRGDLAENELDFERMRYTFLASNASADSPVGELDWGLRNGNLIKQRNLSEAMKTIRSGVHLALAFPERGRASLIYDAPFMSRFFELLAQTEVDASFGEQQAGDYRKEGKTKLEIWGELAAAQMLLYPELALTVDHKHPLLRKLEVFRNGLAIKTNSDEGRDTEVVRLAEVEASITLLNSETVRLDKSGLYVVKKQRDPFNSFDWVKISPQIPVVN